MNNNPSMVTVSEAERIVLQQVRDYGNEHIPFELALSRVLAEDIIADRDLPPVNRVTMDGIAIQYASFEKGVRSFRIKATIAAGEMPVDIEKADECVEIMTGAALPETLDTVIRYEDLDINNGIATIKTGNIKKGQNLHLKGRDKKKGDIAAAANQIINPALISLAASLGKSRLWVKKLPKVVIISTGGELVDVDVQPTPWQTRRSNSYMVKAVLQQHALTPDMLHIPDDLGITRKEIQKCLAEYDVIILSGGVSMGKFDYVPRALEEAKVTRLFHKVRQRPGKPYWFGAHPDSHRDGTLVFAFPGNPVSTFLCLHRYFLPWLNKSLKSPSPLGEGRGEAKEYAVLDNDVTFTVPLQYFMQVKLNMNEHGQLIATPMEGHGSGDFANLTDTDAFMELPLEKDIFKKGEVYRVWPF